MVGSCISVMVSIDFINIVGIHFEIITKYSKPCLNSSSPHYSSFMQYMKSNNMHYKITQLPLPRHDPLWTFSSFWNLFVWFHPICSYRIHVSSFVYSWFKVLFVNNMIMFVVLKGRKHSCPIEFLFQDNVNVFIHVS
jgi:hypothetical protein